MVILEYSLEHSTRIHLTPGQLPVKGNRTAMPTKVAWYNYLEEGNPTRPQHQTEVNGE